MNNSRKRKMLLILPLLVIPFLTLAFWAMGGGKKSAPTTDRKQGLNLHLPQANLEEDKVLDKLGFYDKADKDSMKLEEWMRSDPYYKKSLDEPLSSPQPEEKLMQRITQLQDEISKPASYEYPIAKKDFSAELESMMQTIEKPAAEDPEIKQLEGALDKILDIQHPERVKERLNQKRAVETTQLLTVSEQASSDTISKGFYGLDQPMPTDLTSNAIEAVVHENQSLVNGAVIKIRLLQDIYIKDEKIPKDNFVFGIAKLNDERLHIEISSIRSRNSLFNVKLEVFDMDGLPGVYIPGAINRDVAKQSADNSLQLLEMSSLDPSFKAQATAAGIGAAKNLFSKKIKLVKVVVKAGYKILLKDKSIPS